jgi:hypothetical protein
VDILSWFERVNEATCNTDNPEAAILAHIRERDNEQYMRGRNAGKLDAKGTNTGFDGTRRVYEQAEVDGMIAAARSETLAQAAQVCFKISTKCPYPTEHDACDYFGCFDFQRAGLAIRNLAPDPNYRKRVETEAAIAEAEWWLRYRNVNPPTEVELKHFAELLNRLERADGKS